MSFDKFSGLPSDYSLKIKRFRTSRALTQAQLADLLGVSYISVNRWENEQSRPNKLAWQRVQELAQQSGGGLEGEQAAGAGTDAPPSLDFSADPNVVAAIAEAHRLSNGHLSNPAFATETSLIDPLPHQRIAVYQHMLQQSPLRFLLADDAGAGKTIMTGLYVREMLSRQKIRRILIVPPAGLVGNWEREMRILFRLSFQIVSGTDARAGNPFLGEESNLVIVSVDTLAGERMFAHLKDRETAAYDLVVFDEAHKLSANRDGNFRVKKTQRYQLAEALAGGNPDGENPSLHWSAQHLLLLTATPHMGKDYPYYSLWRLLLPDKLSTYEAFINFSREEQKKHFIRRTKEEMVHPCGSPLYATRECDTLGYELVDSEQKLYEKTTEYIQRYYNRAKNLNRSAAQLAMSVFQRRLASSTYALMRSFERRKEKLAGLIKAIQHGDLTEESFRRQQLKSPAGLKDIFETHTADEDTTADGEYEQNEEFEAKALEYTSADNLHELEEEHSQVGELLSQAEDQLKRGEDAKFRRLRELLNDSQYARETCIIFTEHRDTAEFLVRRLEGLGLTGRIARIHGGMPYQEREQQVEFFSHLAEEAEAGYLVATDAAGEGINLQFCWLMVNYDIPWNPARLEQRMGRIHRYGQEHDPVVIANLVASNTREGRVLRTLLEKLEKIRKQLQSDKVFDVVGRLFKGVSIKEYIEQALTGDIETITRELEGELTEKQVQALEEKERSLFGEGGDVKSQLPRLKEEAERENYLRLLPGYVRCFVEKAASLLNLQVEGNLDGNFKLEASQPGAIDPLLPEFEKYSEQARGQLTFHKPKHHESAIWIYPGEPVFNRIATLICERFGREGLKGAIFIDPEATEPYLFHIAWGTVEQYGLTNKGTADLFEEPDARNQVARLLEAQLIGLRQSSDDSIEESPIERLLLLRSAKEVAPGQIPLATLARGMLPAAKAFALEKVLEDIVQTHKKRHLDELPSHIKQLKKSVDFKAAELAGARAKLTKMRNNNGTEDKQELSRVKEQQRGLNASHALRLAELQAEAEQIRAGEFRFLAHALVVPSQDDAESMRYDARVEAIAVQVATAYEKSFAAVVKDVSKPELAQRVLQKDWPGFDLLSKRPTEDERAIEVKGRAASGDISMSENEWSAACNQRKKYWLYVVFNCASQEPRLFRINDPFRKLLAKNKGGVVIPGAEIQRAAEQGTL